MALNDVTQGRHLMSSTFVLNHLVRFGGGANLKIAPHDAEQLILITQK